jgi:hypothetical protein
MILHFYSQFGAGPRFLVRHRTTHEVLSAMLPDDIYQYCQQHQLLDAMVGDGDSPPPVVPSTSSEKSC